MGKLGRCVWEQTAKLDKSHGHKVHKRRSGRGSVLTLCRAAPLSTIFVEHLSSYRSASYAVSLLRDRLLLSSTAAEKTSTATKAWVFFHANNEDKIRVLSSFL